MSSLYWSLLGILLVWANILLVGLLLFISKCLYSVAFAKQRIVADRSWREVHLSSASFLLSEQLAGQMERLMEAREKADSVVVLDGANPALRELRGPNGQSI